MSRKKMRINSKMEVRKVGTEGCQSGGLNKPCGIALDECGWLYVADSGNNRILCFDKNNQFVYCRYWLGTEGDQFCGPRGIAIGQRRWQHEWAFALKEIPQIAGFPPGLLSICMAYMHMEQIHVADTDNHRICVFWPDGQYVDQWGEKGQDDGQFDEPFEICVDAQGSLYVADVCDSRIQVFSMEGTFFNSWQADGNVVCLSKSPTEGIWVCCSSGPLALYSAGGVKLTTLVYHPQSVVYESAQNIMYMADEKDCVIRCFSRDKETLNIFPLRVAHTWDHSFVSTALGPDGSFYICDAENSCVFVCTFDGPVLAE